MSAIRPPSHITECYLGSSWIQTKMGPSQKPDQSRKRVHLVHGSGCMFVGLEWILKKVKLWRKAQTTMYIPVIEKIILFRCIHRIITEERLLTKTHEEEGYLYKYCPVLSVNVNLPKSVMVRWSSVRTSRKTLFSFSMTLFGTLPLLQRPFFQNTQPHLGYFFCEVDAIPSSTNGLALHPTESLEGPKMICWFSSGHHRRLIRGFRMSEGVNRSPFVAAKLSLTIIRNADDMALKMG